MVKSDSRLPVFVLFSVCFSQVVSRMLNDFESVRLCYYFINKRTFYNLDYYQWPDSSTDKLIILFCLLL